MMNIKSAYFYAALAAALGAGYGSGVVSQKTGPERYVPCEDSVADKQFRAPQPMNSKGKGF